MRRRRYLALAASSGVAGLAGCGAPFGDGDGTPMAGDSPTPDSDGDDEPLLVAQAELEVAAQSLSLAEAPDRFDEIAMAYGYDEPSVTASIDEAEAALDRAATMAGGQDDQTVAFLREYAAFLRARMPVLDAVVGIADRITTATAAAADDRYDDVIAELEAAQEAVPDARTGATDLSDRLDSLADEAPEETDLPLESFRTSMVVTADVITVMDEHAHGGVRMAAGARETDRADDIYADGEYSRAKSGYLTADAEYDEAKTRYQDAEQRVDIGLRTELTRRTCWAKTHIEAIDHLIEACDHAIAGRFGKAGDSRKRAQSTIEEADCAPL